MPLVLIGFISSGAVLVYEMDLDANGPMLNPKAVIVVGDNGIGSLTRYPDPTPRLHPGDDARSSRRVRRSSVYSIDLGLALDSGEALRTNESRGVTRVRLNTTTGGQEIVDLATTPSGDFTYLSNNSPDALFVLDSSLVSYELTEEDDTVLRGSLRPRLGIFSTVPQAGQPSGLAYLPRPGGDVLLAASFRDDALFVNAVDGPDRRAVSRVDGVAAGPFTVQPVNLVDSQVLFISSFFDHGLSIVNVPFGELENTARVAQLRNPDMGVANEQRWGPVALLSRRALSSPSWWACWPRASPAPRIRSSSPPRSPARAPSSSPAPGTTGCSSPTPPRTPCR